MPNEEGHKLNLPAVISEFELPKAIGGRALKAVTDLMGNAVDRWAAKLEDVPKKSRAKTAREIKQSDRLDEEITARLIADDPFMGRMIENKKRQWLKEQSNVDKITQDAVAFLPEFVEEGEPVSDADISDDWIHNFRDFSGRVSDDDVQQIWSKLLANEMMKPGSFSLPTLSVISKIDSATAHTISKYLNHDTEGRLFLSNKIETDFGTTTLDLDLQEIQNLGIVAGVNADLSMGLTPINETPQKSLKIRLGDTNYIFHFEKEISKVAVNCVLLTNVGRDLLKLLPMESAVKTALRMKNLSKPAPVKIAFQTTMSDGKIISGEV